MFPIREDLERRVCDAIHSDRTASPYVLLNQTCRGPRRASKKPGRGMATCRRSYHTSSDSGRCRSKLEGRKSTPLALPCRSTLAPYLSIALVILLQHNQQYDPETAYDPGFTCGEATQSENLAEVSSSPALIPHCVRHEPLHCIAEARRVCVVGWCFTATLSRFCTPCFISGSLAELQLGKQWYVIRCTMLSRSFQDQAREWSMQGALS